MSVTPLRPALQRGDVRRADLPVMPPMILAADVEEGEPPFLLDGVLHVETLLMLYAPSNSFKSFVAMTLACAVAAGEDPVPFLANDLAREAVEAGAVPNPFSRIREQTKAEVERRRNGDGLTLEERLGMDPRPDAAQDELARRLGMR